MTILLYDHCELEERASRHLKAWKAWHLVLFSCAAIFGIVNYIFLQNTMELVDNNCVLYPRELEFQMIEITWSNSDMRHDANFTAFNETNAEMDMTENAQVNETVPTHVSTDKVAVKTETKNNTNTMNIAQEITVIYGNATIIIGNKTHRLMLDTSRTLFESDSTCQFAEYMPILSTIFAGVWITMFTMCPSGGHARSGLQQPWRILAPALLFAFIMVGLTGHSFNITNGGLHAFCESFYEVTNATSCSAVDPFLMRGWNASWSMGGRAGATRAASAAVWASWACAAALMLARCIAAPDFQVKRVGVYLTKDPQRKITPYLKKSPRLSRVSFNDSPSKRDDVSIRSDPTVITELVTASVEPGQDSVSTSLTATPIRGQVRSDLIEMTYTPQKHKEEHSALHQDAY